MLGQKTKYPKYPGHLDKWRMAIWFDERQEPANPEKFATPISQQRTTRAPEKNTPDSATSISVYLNGRLSSAFETKIECR